MSKNIKELGKLFFTFLKIGAFTFGGGYAMIPLIQKETVEKNKWISDEDILEIFFILPLSTTTLPAIPTLCPPLTVMYPSFNSSS